jgi:hypothetical protein
VFRSLIRTPAPVNVHNSPFTTTHRCMPWLSSAVPPAGLTTTPTLDGAGGTAERLGRLARRQAVPAGEREYFPVTRRKSRERLGERQLQLGGFGVRLFDILEQAGDELIVAA